MSINHRIYRSVSEMPEELVKDLVNTGEIHLDPEYLLSLESAGMRGFAQYYCEFFVDGSRIGFAVYQVVDMESDEPTGYLSVVPAWKLLFPKQNIEENTIRAKVLVGGDVFGTGVKLFRFDASVSDDTIWTVMCDAGKAIAAEQDEKIDFWLIKDFVENDAPEVPARKEGRLTKVYSEPLMILRADAKWRSFDDYKSALKTKFRTKLNAAYKRSEHIVFRELSAEEVCSNAEELYELYRGLWRKANFRPGKLNPQVLKNWSRLMPEKCKVQALYLEDRIVAFQLGFFMDDVLDAILVGFDLELNREYSLLECMLYEFVKWGVERGVKEIRFGRTAGELKSTIGATPLEAFGMVRHQNTALNRLAMWIGPRLKPQTFPIRSPFKQDYQPGA